MAQEIKMSAAGLKAMQEELEYLKTVRRKELAEEIKEARSHGDLHSQPLRDGVYQRALLSHLHSRPRSAHAVVPH